MLRSYTSGGTWSERKSAGPPSSLENIEFWRATQENWLDLTRDGANVTWKRENGDGGTLELTEAGQLRGVGGDPILAQQIWMLKSWTWRPKHGRGS